MTRLPDDFATDRRPRPPLTTIDAAMMGCAVLVTLLFWLMVFAWLVVTL